MGIVAFLRSTSRASEFSWRNPAEQTHQTRNQKPVPWLSYYDVSFVTLWRPSHLSIWLQVKNTRHPKNPVKGKMKTYIHLGSPALRFSVWSASPYQSLPFGEEQQPFPDRQVMEVYRFLKYFFAGVAWAKNVTVCGAERGRGRKRSHLFLRSLEILCCISILFISALSLLRVISLYFGGFTKRPLKGALNNSKFSP